MPKNRSTWKTNPNAVDSPYIYDQPGVTYDTIYPIYNGTASVPSTTKNRSTFTKVSKNRSNFNRNPAALGNLHAYDSANTYDNGTISYDGLTANEPIESTKRKSNWTPK